MNLNEFKLGDEVAVFNASITGRLTFVACGPILEMSIRARTGEGAIPQTLVLVESYGIRPQSLTTDKVSSWYTLDRSIIRPATPELKREFEEILAEKIQRLRGAQESAERTASHQEWLDSRRWILGLKRGEGVAIIGGSGRMIGMGKFHGVADVQYSDQKSILVKKVGDPEHKNFVFDRKGHGIHGFSGLSIEPLTPERIDEWAKCPKAPAFQSYCSRFWVE